MFWCFCIVLQSIKTEYEIIILVDACLHNYEYEMVSMKIISNGVNNVRLMAAMATILCPQGSTITGHDLCMRTVYIKHWCHAYFGQLEFAPFLIVISYSQLGFCFIFGLIWWCEGVWLFGWGEASMEKEEATYSLIELCKNANGNMKKPNCPFYYF